MSDTEENLSVEDILSSIKNILVDENGAPIDNTDTPAEETPAEKPIEEDTVADVFNLDDSMIVPDQPETTDRAETETTNSEEPTIEAATSSEPADSIDLQETLNMAENLDISGIPELNNILEQEPQKEQEESKETPEIKEEPIADSEDSFSSVQDIVNSIKVERPSAVREETIDTSASLINNFAKVFAEKQREQAQLKLNSQLTEEVVSKALEDKIESLDIPELVQEEILKQIKALAEEQFERLAKKIITELTQKWIDANLQQVVEKAVSAEIERVIAKVEI
ncbi:MAG: DUF2497 domain-containing protein [Alphaproteobacteria bacterium]|nr:DUF2497 domain-containing protein [Alphaproteobacteria bacterium]